MGLLDGAAGAGRSSPGSSAGRGDRLDGRMLLIACDLARMALYALIPLAWDVRAPIWLLVRGPPAG